MAPLARRRATAPAPLLALAGSVLAALTGLATGCAPAGAGASPRATLEAFQRAARRDDAASLYALLPASARREESFARFQSRIRAERRELGDLAGTMQRALDEGRTPHVDVPMAGGGAASVVEEPEGWRMSQSGFGPVAAASPADAARALRAALMRQSLPALLQVLSSRARGALQAEIASLIDALSDPEGLDITSTSTAGQRLEIHLPDGRTLVLVREGNVWRIDDVR